MNGRAITIAVDVMGGDRGPAEVIRGIAVCRDQNHRPMRFVLFGRQEIIEPEIAGYDQLAHDLEIVHCDQVIANDEPPAKTLLRKRRSSLYHCIDAVRRGNADAAVSGGNSGAMMAISVVLLSRLASVDRPALLATFPSQKGPVALLDCGMNLQTQAHHLVQFALMGHVFAQIAHNRERPSIALMNVGSERGKGPDHVRLADNVLSNKTFDLNYIGFIEGDGLPLGKADVVVVDGFGGNLVLKSVEGTAKLIRTLMMQAFQHGWITKIAALALRPVLKDLLTDLDPRQYNGALISGLNGLIVKSHGGSDGYAIAQAINLAGQLTQENFLARTKESLDNLTPEMWPDRSIMMKSVTSGPDPNLSGTPTPNPATKPSRPSGPTDQENKPMENPQ